MLSALNNKVNKIKNPAYRPIIPIIPTHGEGEGRVDEALSKLNVTTWDRKVCNLERRLSKGTNCIINYHTISPRETMTAKQMEPITEYPSRSPIGPPYANEVAVPSYEKS